METAVIILPIIVVILVLPLQPLLRVPPLRLMLIMTIRVRTAFPPHEPLICPPCLKERWLHIANESQPVVFHHKREVQKLSGFLLGHSPFCVSRGGISPMSLHCLFAVMFSYLLPFSHVFLPRRHRTLTTSQTVGRTPPTPGVVIVLRFFIAVVLDVGFPPSLVLTPPEVSTV